MVWLADLVVSALGTAARPLQLSVDRELLSGIAGSASFCIWLLAQTPQIYENYVRGSVAGLSPFFLIQWMFGDLTNLIGAVLTHQLFFQIALATYFCCIDTVLLGQFWYYSRAGEAGDDVHAAAVSVEEAERLLEEQPADGEVPSIPSQSRPDSIRSTSTRSRWGYHSMRQGSGARERSVSYRERSQSTGRHRRRLTSNTDTLDSSVPSLLSSHEDLRAPPQSPSTPHQPSHHAYQHGPHHDPASSPLVASISGMSVTYRALSEAAMSVAQIADEAAERRIRGRDREIVRAEVAVRSPRVEGSRSRMGTQQRSRSERSVVRTGAGMVLLGVGMLFAVGKQGDMAGQARQADVPSHARLVRWLRSGASVPGAAWSVGSRLRAQLPFHADVALEQAAERKADMTLRTVTSSSLDTGTAAIGINFLDLEHHHVPSYSDLARRDGSTPESNPRHDRKPGPRPDRPGSPNGPGQPGQGPPPKESINWEQVIGRGASWTCTVLYLTSRLPQIWTNHMRKSVEGLSMLLFIAAFFGNFFYSISILANPKAGDWWTLASAATTTTAAAARGPTSLGDVGTTLTPENKAYLRESLPFLLGSFGACFFDVTILSQWFAFR